MLYNKECEFMRSIIIDKSALDMGEMMEGIHRSI